jgi:hypothetical protein
MSFADFEKLLYAFKSNIPSIVNPILGKAWDINRIMGPVFKADLYNTMKNADGKYVPTQFTSESAALMDVMWKWAKDGVWENDSGQKSDSERTRLFLNGQSAVYMSYPEITNLISIMRGLKEAKPTAEFMMLAPFKDSDGNVNGFQKLSRSFNGMIIPSKNGNEANTVKFLDWVYSDSENYELCKYGIKGTHWVEGEDAVIGGKTYKTWQYPADKTDQFRKEPPYSGKYLLLDNINVSNRINGDYNFQEKVWYTLSTDVFPAFVSEAPEGIWMPEVSSGDLKIEANRVNGNFVEKIRGKCWAGLGSDSMTTLLNTYIAEMNSDASNYLNYINAQLHSSVDYFDQLFAQNTALGSTAL